MSVIRKILDAITSRIVLVVFGVVVAVFGLVSPTRTMNALRYSLLTDATKGLFCKDC